jgi:hypothetical protein
MLTGGRLFKGEDASEILASVIKEQPQWEAVPAEARRLIRKCLEKDRTKPVARHRRCWPQLLGK